MSRANNDASIVLPLDLIVNTSMPGLAEYQGSRAMLEAEGVIPSGTKWPQGYADHRWVDGKFRYWLTRRRLDGAKGPRSMFIDVDWWHFCWEPINAESHVTLVIKRKAKELADYAYRNTSKGQAESRKQWAAFYKSRDDQQFQAFKALVPGLIPPKRGRKASQQEGAAA